MMILIIIIIIIDIIVSFHLFDQASSVHFIIFIKFFYVKKNNNKFLFSGIKKCPRKQFDTVNDQWLNERGKKWWKKYKTTLCVITGKWNFFPLINFFSIFVKWRKNIGMSFVVVFIVNHHNWKNDWLNFVRIQSIGW